MKLDHLLSTAPEENKLWSSGLLLYPSLFFSSLTQLSPPFIFICTSVFTHLSCFKTSNKLFEEETSLIGWLHCRFSIDRSYALSSDTPNPSFQQEQDVRCPRQWHRSGMTIFILVVPSWYFTVHFLEFLSPPVQSSVNCLLFQLSSAQFNFSLLFSSTLSFKYTQCLYLCCYDQ